MMPIDSSTTFCLLLIVMSVIFTIKSSVLGLTICAIATLILHSIALDPAIDPTPIVVLSVLMTIYEKISIVTTCQILIKLRFYNFQFFCIIKNMPRWG